MDTFVICGCVEEATGMYGALLPVRDNKHSRLASYNYITYSCRLKAIDYHFGWWASWLLIFWASTTLTTLLIIGAATTFTTATAAITIVTTVHVDWFCNDVTVVMIMETKTISVISNHIRLWQHVTHLRQWDDQSGSTATLMLWTT